MCISHTLNRGGKRAEFTPEMALKKINPLLLPELKYLCKDCIEDYLPDKKDGLKKSVEKSRTESVSQATREPVPVAEAENLTQTGADAPDHTHAQPGAEAPDHTPEARGLFPPPTRNEPQNNGPPGQVPPDGNPPPNDDPHTHDDRIQPIDICSFYIKGTCRYGISGRLCPKYHPKACKKLLQNGNKSPNGCNLGKNCDKHHPQMCYSSLRTRTCYNQDCKLVHVKGTKRIKQQSNNPSQSPAHIPRLQDFRPNQQQNPTHDRQHSAQAHLNYTDQYYQSQQDYEHDQRLTVQSQPSNTQQYYHGNQDYEHERTNGHSTPPNQMNFLEEALHSINSLKQEMRMQLQQVSQHPPQMSPNILQQTLQKFREELMEEMNQRLAPYPPLSRSNMSQEAYGEQDNAGQYPGHRAETPRYNQLYRRNPAN